MSEGYKPHFQKFFDAEPGRLHFAAHSHHPWPDASFEGQQRAWRDAVALVDEKWDRIFGEVWPTAQRHVAQVLRLPDPDSVVFGPNTHDFVVRLLSCLRPRPRIVTSDGEFHSFERQLRRFEEDDLVQVVRVPAEPFATFGERLAAEAKRQQPDLVFFSHVFFNSGAVVRDVDEVVRAIGDGPLIAIDGYHAFLATPVNLSTIAARAFYLGGGYKYAMSGEGVCFLHVPPDAPLRPRETGWFAAFGNLQDAAAGQVPYAKDGMRFMGATFDPSGLYRFNAVMAWRQSVGLTVERALSHVRALQQRLVRGLPRTLREEELVVPLGDDGRGHFLTFRRDDARDLVGRLRAQRVITDARDDRFRIGFGVYQDSADVDRLLELLARL